MHKLKITRRTNETTTRDRRKVKVFKQVQADIKEVDASIAETQNASSNVQKF